MSGLAGETGKRIKTKNAALKIVWFQYSADVCERHEATTKQHTTLNNRTLYVLYQFKYFVTCKKSR